MENVVAILVESSDPLLRGIWTCNSKPPQVYMCACGTWTERPLVEYGCGATSQCKIARVAIPVWWEGAVHPVGWDLIRRVFWVNGSGGGPGVFKDAEAFLPTLEQVIEVAVHLVPRHVTWIFYLAKDHSGRLLEATNA